MTSRRPEAAAGPPALLAPPMSARKALTAAVMSAGLEPAAVRGLELEGRMLDVEVVGQATAQGVEHVGGLCAVLDDHVCRHDVHSIRG